ncbi:hypothetical protein Cycma_1470 [Cyclobacterium marinum DSM 745]|uniref:Uncharacterized protein n=1 Tax=Cyclobacterium marinum (strain ATCC 25205 / DSM 745 / LMG 13164 / NCIMB 1802) TaxID=880070 RepID=G0J3N3_CYCMS|nr:hypothetical protein Cycma_1470 [Cyclobacterium marinum DSM 745]
MLSKFRVCKTDIYFYGFDSAQPPIKEEVFVPTVSKSIILKLLF